MIPVMKQERPNTAKLYFCECGRRLVPGDDHGTERWAYCPRCGQHIEWDQVKPVVWEEKQCKSCGSWLVQKMSYGGFYASSDYIGEDVCKVCWIKECLHTNYLSVLIGFCHDGFELVDSSPSSLTNSADAYIIQK